MIQARFTGNDGHACAAAYRAAAAVALRVPQNTKVPNTVEVTKTRGSSALVSASGTIPYVITVANTGQWDMTGFEVVDQIETDAEGSLLVEPTPPAYTFALSGSGAPANEPRPVHVRG